jgi:secreted PhoX family phosphatase
VAPSTPPSRKLQGTIFWRCHGTTRVFEVIFQFAKNNVVLSGQRNGITGDFRGSEFVGACYSPDGGWLFVNVQSPGITFAITGPWHTGAL